LTSRKKAFIENTALFTTYRRPLSKYTMTQRVICILFRTPELDRFLIKTWEFEESANFACNVERVSLAQDVIDF
jgi:hypothetical protein